MPKGANILSLNKITHKITPAGIKLGLLGIGFCLIWSSAFITGKMVVGLAPPHSFLSARFLIAGLILAMAVVIINRSSLILSRQELTTGTVLGILNNAIYLGLCWYAFTITSAGMVAIIAGLGPLMTAAIAHFWLQDRLNWRKIIGLALGLSGAWWIIFARINPDNMDILPAHSDSPLGITLAFIGVLALSLGTVVYRRYGAGEHNDPVRMNMIQNIASGLVLVPFALFEDWSSIQFTPELGFLLFYTVFVISILALLMWFAMIRLAGASAASSFLFLNPGLALIFAWLILDEAVSLTDLLGIIPIALGIALVSQPSHRR